MTLLRRRFCGIIKENKRSETGQNGRDLTNGSSGQGLYFAGSRPSPLFGPSPTAILSTTEERGLYTKRRRKHEMTVKGQASTMKTDS